MTAQQLGPAPPRLQIPGAIPLGAIPISDGPFRNERVLPSPGLVRIRRPPQVKQQHINQLPIPIQRSIEEAKPVNEENEEETFIPQIIQQQQQQQPHQNNHISNNVPSLENFFETQAPRFAANERPQPIQRISAPVPERHNIQNENTVAAQRFNYQPERAAPQPIQSAPKPIVNTIIVF